MQNRKQRSDSVTAALTAHSIAQQDLPFEWPDSLELPQTEIERDLVLATFANLQMAREPSWWRPHHCSQLAQLALLELQKAKLIDLLTKNGTLTRNERGTITRSPVMDALSQLQGVISQSLKPLGISPTQLERDKHSANILNARRQHNHPLLANGSDDGLDLLS